jgi:protein-S-isoprenylcysteine O-methyltransferase Ste14
MASNEIAYIVGLIASAAIRVVYTTPYRKSTVSDDRKSATDIVLMIFSSFGLVFLPLVYLLTPWLDFADYSLRPWAGWAGVTILAVALWLLWRSHVDLGRNWTPTLQILGGHSLVSDGVFGTIRHPLYAAHLLLGAAQLLLLQNGVAGPSMLVTMLPVYVYRAPREERMMLDHFGDSYRAYMKRTGRLMPRLTRSD